MAEERIRDELDKIKNSELLTYIGCSAGPQRKTNIFKWNHPNISIDDGAICVSSKSTEWENHKNLITVIYSIFDLLKNPNESHGLNNDALLLFKTDKKEFQKIATEFTEKNSLIFIQK